jgi:hypothetical protein
MKGHGKGISTMLSFVIVMAITLTVISSVLLSGRDTLDSAITSVDISDAEAMLMVLDRRIQEVSSEGNGSSRTVEITTPGGFEIDGSSDTVSFRVRTGFLEYFSRSQSGSILFVSGNDVSCSRADADLDGDTDLVMENSFVRAVFQYVNMSSPLSQINTSGTVISVRSKVLDSAVSFSDTGIFIDGGSSSGSGYTELQREAANLPVCTVHAFVDSTVDYDVYYRLYAGADFISAEVKIREP